MIECPDCGKNFRSLKCSCGYTPPKSEEARQQTMDRLADIRRASQAAASVDLELSKSMISVLGTMTHSGPRRWAYEIVALADAGIYRGPDHIAEEARALVGSKMNQDELE